MPSFSFYSKFTPNDEQKEIVRSIRDNAITLVSGAAGTGKTCISAQTLAELLRTNEIRKIIIVRLISDTFGEHVGALPGTFTEKLEPFSSSVLDNLHQIMTKPDIERLKLTGQLETIPVSQVRGRTFIDAGVIVEEAQNLSDHMILAVLTRIGRNSRMVLTGDPDQVDYPKRNGILYASQLLEDIPEAGVIQLSLASSYRHPIIPKIINKAQALKNLR